METKLKTWLGRIIRDIERKTQTEASWAQTFKSSLFKAKRIYSQKQNDSHKLYSWHAPEVECISKGKTHKPYEFGCKVSIITHVNPAPAGHFVLHAKSLPGNPFDGHTLQPILNALIEQNGIEPKRIYVDKGYRRHDYSKKERVFKSGQKQGMTARIRRELKRRSAIEPVIGHLKSDGRLGRNYLQGPQGDKMNALLVAAGYNFRLILRWLRNFLSFIFYYPRKVYKIFLVFQF